MRSGFVTLVGRPNVGKSSLLNAVCGRKVSIVSDKPQTTRTRVRAVVNTSDTQVVFVDTPGIHKPVSALGRRVNATAVESISEVDVACLVIDATQTFGRGDRFVAERMDMKRSAVVLNKTDATTHAKIAKQLSALAELDALAYFPVSARTGDGVAAWMQWLSTQMPEGQALFPPEMVRETPDTQWVAELVRESLLARTREEPALVETTTTSSSTSTLPAEQATPTTTIVEVLTEQVELFFVSANRVVRTERFIVSPATPTQVLDTLLAGLDSQVENSGLRSALPAKLTATIDVRRGIARVASTAPFLSELEPLDQRLAIAQIVLTLTRRPGIGQVIFTVDGADISVPRGGGDLTAPGTAV
ncbi:MAG: GTPase Era, partial [Actinobacteria bacterium]|nr:GTPase Era [Actinomycetota bacterium]